MKKYAVTTCFDYTYPGCETAWAIVKEIANKLSVIDSDRDQVQALINQYPEGYGLQIKEVHCE